MDKKLSYLWQAPRLLPDRFLFITFAFNFRDFHNNILPRLMEASGGERPQIDIVASSHDQEQGECYSVRHLLELGDSFRLHLINKAVVPHAKVIVAIDSHRAHKGIIAGLGSANLTPSGWTKNIEAWSWDPTIAGVAKDLLIELSSSGHISKDLALRWTRWIGAARAQATDFVLSRRQKEKFGEVLARLREGAGAPRLVRIVSPYFDKGSSDLLQQIAAVVPKGATLELWTDSAGVSTRKDRELARRLKLQAGKHFKNVLLLSPCCGEDSVPLHAKLIEFEGPLGLSRAFGSANFTGAAWNLKGRGNIELVRVERKAGSSFKAILEELEYRGAPLVAQGAVSSDDEELEEQQKAKVLWASLDEEAGPELTAQLELGTKDIVEDAWIEVSSDAQRPVEDRRKLEAASAGIQDRASWTWCLGTQLSAVWKGPRRFICGELMELKVKVSGSIISAPIWVSRPDPTVRDAQSGIPIDPKDMQFADLLNGRQKSIVPPLQRRTKVHFSDELDEELAQEDESLLGLSDPDADFHPPLVSLAKKLNGAKKDVGLRKMLGILEREGDLTQAILAQAANIALGKK